MAAVLAATAWLARPMHLYDTDQWPDQSQFRSTDSLKGVLSISAVVKVTDRTPPPGNGGGDWYSIIYDIKITNVSGKPVRDLVVGVKMDPKMRPWILSHMLEFGTGQSGIDLIPGKEPFGVYVSRISGVPNPRTLEEPDRTRLIEAIRTPLWLKITWNGEPHYIRLDPEEIHFEGLSLLE
ncbi:hypothetical protein [Thermaerobacter marianensis]|uniref:hypothetical protein n=1 Tax=Thermaerobacter marianensis TaxID=73919 RepID=UPI0011D2BDA4|nr:hypothetical protein [Thermaerobacter marianensis]